MSEHPQQPYEDDAEPGSADTGDRPMRQGWFYYVAVFFIVIAGICFVLSSNFNFDRLPPRPPIAPSGADK